jgi:hypothetical protein
MSEAVESGSPEISASSHTETQSVAPTLPAIAGPIVVRARVSRVVMLAIAMALSAAAGSTVGAMAAAAFTRPQPVSNDDARTIEVNSLRGVITQLSAEVASLKASIDNNAKAANAQIAKIADRVDRAQSEPAARVQKLSELMEKLDRRTAAAPAQAQAPALAAAGPEVTGSVAPKQQDRPVVAGWIIREVFDGRAVIENERLGFYEVVPGANLPGIGRVETIRRQDGRWVVVTPKGLIVSQR